jgi:hypothetical protein
VKRLPEKAEPHLAALERLGRSAFDAGTHDQLVANGAAPDLIAASWELVNLGIRDAVQAPQIPGEPARVVIAAGAGGAATSAVISRVVQKVASRRDNRLKLQAAREAVAGTSSSRSIRPRLRFGALRAMSRPGSRHACQRAWRSLG